MGAYRQLDFNDPNIVGDKVIYYVDSNSDSKYNQGEEIIHSAIVKSVDSAGYTTTVEGKMGQLGISVNHPNAPGYYERNQSGTRTSRAYFR